MVEKRRTSFMDVPFSTLVHFYPFQTKILKVGISFGFFNFKPEWTLGLGHFWIFPSQTTWAEITQRMLFHCLRIKIK